MKYLSLFYLLLFASCSSEPKPVVTTETVTPVAAKDSLERGKVISSIPLKSDASQSFALYLPTNYSDSAKFPVIIFFDPHGDGALPLNLYKGLAEEFHFILIGSNSSKNGMSLEQCNLVANNLIGEATQRFKVDGQRLVFCGFSGGAKVALLSGSANTSVSTIIYCGAAQQVAPNHPVKLLGFVGKKDMNYTEVVSFDQNLKGTPGNHLLIEWNGKHEFPTADVLRDAFVFLTKGSVDNYEKKKPTITPAKMQQEQAIKQQLINALQEQDLNWWKMEIASLNKQKKTDLMYERLLGFVSLACYSISNNALQQNNLHVAEQILPIYALADPENEDCKKFKEVLRQRQGK